MLVYTSIQCILKFKNVNCTAHFDEVKTALAEWKKKSLTTMSSAYLPCSKAPQIVLVLITINKERGQPDESYMNRQFTLKFLDDVQSQKVQISFSGSQL